MKNIFKDDTVARTLRNASQLTMKVLLVAFAVLAMASALQNQYAPVYNTINAHVRKYDGEDNSGQYIPDDSGRYIPDHSGDYRHDGSGGYAGDGSGNYKGDGSGIYNGGGGGYKGDGSDGSGYQNGGDGRYGHGGSGGDGRYGHGGSGGKYGGFGSGSGFGKQTFGSIANSNLIGQGSNENNQVVKLSSSTGTGSGFGSGYGSGNSGGVFGNTGSASSVISKGSGFGGNPNYSGAKYDQGRYADGRWKIIRQSGDVDTDGYHWEYENENGISAEESGKLHNKGTDAEAMKAKGFFQYTGTDNVVYYVKYTADENGFIPEGNHLPTPPPIPLPILKSLEYLKANGKL